MTHYYYCYFTA